MRRAWPVLTFVIAAVCLLGACSSDLSSSDASGRMQIRLQAAGSDVVPGGNADPLDLAAFCGANEARNSTSEINGYMVASCFVFDDRTSTFTAPGEVSNAAPLPLTVPRFTSNATPSATMLGGYQPGNASGVVSGERIGSARTDICDPADPTRCPGRLTPNPFTGTAAMAIEPIQPWEGTVNRLDVNSRQAPFALDQRPAVAWMANTWSGTPTAGCDNGRFLACTLVSGFDPRVHGGHQRPRFELTTWPLRVSIQNSLTSAVRLSLRPLVDIDSQNLLRDPKADTVLPVVGGITQGVVPGRSLEYGGYRAIDGVVVWQGLFELVDANGGISCNGCGTVITVTVRVDPTPAEPGKKSDPYAGSSCEVTVVGTKTLVCDAPSFSGSVRGSLLATVNIKDF